MDISWQQATELLASQRLDVLTLLNATEAALSREAIDEGRRRTVVHGWPARHYLRYQNGQLTHYAQADLTARPTIEMNGGGIDEALLTLLLGEFEQVHWWTRGGEDSDFPRGTVMRKLLLLSVDLPVTVEVIPENSVLRPFEPTRDEDAWLVQNNEAFANHPEQGAWLRADLAQRTMEPWFDPSGFLLLEIDGRLSASCWTKIHELHPDRFGEIYVISVHPDFQGRNLGKVMVTQGMDSLRRKGVKRCVLFVDETNEGARRLYGQLGFQLVREDRLFRFS